MKKTLIILFLITILGISFYFYMFNKCRIDMDSYPALVQIHMRSQISYSNIQKIADEIVDRYPGTVLKIFSAEEDIESQLESYNKNSDDYERVKQNLNSQKGTLIFGKISAYVKPVDIVKNGDFIEFLDRKTSEIGVEYFLSGSVAALDTRGDYKIEYIKKSYKESHPIIWPYYLMSRCVQSSNLLEKIEYKF